MSDDIPIPSQTGDMIEVFEASPGVPTPKGHHRTLSHDDAHSVPDSIASSAKVSYSLNVFVFQLTRPFVSTLGEPFRDDHSHTLP